MENKALTLVTGPLDIYDYLMILFVVIAIIAFFSLAIYVLALPGKVALQRRHPHAETVKWMGWAGFLLVIPWIHALIWAFHDSLTIDIRRFPEEERKAIDDEISRLTKNKGEKYQSTNESAATSKNDQPSESGEEESATEFSSKDSNDTNRT